MKTISIRELHSRTGHFVREASDEAIFVTERGRKIAMLLPINGNLSEGIAFPHRSLNDLVFLKKTPKDSAELISEDRDRG